MALRVVLVDGDRPNEKTGTKDVPIFTTPINGQEPFIVDLLTAIVNELKLSNVHLKKMSGLDITVSDIEEEL